MSHLAVSRSAAWREGETERGLQDRCSRRRQREVLDTLAECGQHVSPYLAAWPARARARPGNLSWTSLDTVAAVAMPVPGPKPWTARLVRSHRRAPGKLSSTLLSLLVLGSMCCGLAGIQLVLRLGIRELVHRIGYLPACGMIMLIFVLVVVGVRLRVLAARRALASWCRQNAWSPVVGRTIWPWTAQQVSSDAVAVQSAVGATAGGYPVVVGEVSWARDGLGGSVKRSNGRGIFAVVRLPRPYPSVSVQRRRVVPRRRAEEDEFTRQFRIVLDDLSFADQLTSRALHEAHVTERVPPWAIVGEELYAVITTRRLLRPALVAALTEEMLFLVRLLGIQSESIESTK